MNMSFKQEKEVKTCPVCNGRGTVPQGFYYSQSNVLYTNSTTEVDICKSCNGKGVIVV